MLLLGLIVNAQLPAANFSYLRRDVDVFSSGFASLTEDNRGYIWFGSRNGGGLYRYDGYTLTPFLFDPSNMKESISTSLIQAICQVNDSLIYIGTYFGYSTLNPVTGVIRSYNNQVEHIEDTRMGNTLFFLQDSAHHVLWLGTAYGLASIDHQTGQFKAYQVTHSDPGQTNIDAIRYIDILPQHPDKLFLAGPKGIFEYDIPLNHYTKINCPLPGSEQADITHVVRDPDGSYWMGTTHGHVLHYNHAKQQWKDYALPNPPSLAGLSNQVYNILYVNPTQLWLATFARVGILHTDTGEFEAWTHEADNPNGLLQTHQHVSLLNDRHGRLWVGSRYGVQIARQAFLPASHNVTDLRVGITKVDIKPILEETQHPLLYGGALSLNREQRDITFHYVLPNPLDPGAVTYQYMLEGSDKEWITTDQRTVRYGKLRGGEYVFRIKAQEGKNGTWTPETSLAISIPKRIAELIWFWIILGAVGIGFTYLLFRYFVSHAKKQATMKAEFEHQLSEIQMQALRAQMNPHFLFNSLNSIKYYAISKSKDETAAYLSKFALLVRTILTNSKSKTISLQQELDALRLYIEIEHLRLEGKFDYRIDIDSSIHIRQTQIPPMILQPFVENAIWHGLMHKDGKGMLLVQVQDVGRQIQCVIEDNGIGRARSAELRKAQMEHRKSEGMQITADRIALINRIYNIHTEVDVIDLEHADGTAAGTRVVVHVPLIRDE